ncbi:MAG: hypothetical protein IKT76_02755 [Bacteroides sp.]|nr:hypothetical protein [Bacteroides sp.]
MKRNLKLILISIISITMCYNVYQNKVTKEKLSDLSLANIEALSSNEGGEECLEWVDKDCYYDYMFGNTHGPYFYPTCSGEPSVSGGKLECGAVSSLLPLSPYVAYKCLACVRTSSGSYE